MKLLISEATLIAPGSPYNGKTSDIVIHNGVVESIATKRITATGGTKVVKAKGMLLSPGWFDMLVHVPDPGHEYRETVASACAAAADGGFTSIAVMPETNPPVHSKSEVEYLLAQSRGQVVSLYPTGAISRKLEGKDLAELYDMHMAGAVAFTEGDRTLQHAGLMQRALQYAQGFGGLIMSRPQNADIAGTAQVNESANTTLLGMKGIPNMAEDLAVSRDLELLRYTGGRLHLSKISTAGAVSLVRKAKKEKLQVTCDVSVNNLVLTDEVLHDYDSNLKLTPPLRSEADRRALLKGLTDGTIDAITSDHNPQDIEHKQVEFEYAPYGATGLQTCYALLNTFLDNELGAELLVEKLAINPRKILNLPAVEFAPGAKADFTLFDPNLKWTFTTDQNLSRSANSPYFNRTFKGRAVAIYNRSQFHSRIIS